jgi:TetR/AcrR family transcriptional regulator, transcriptional repressor for nem operon
MPATSGQNTKGQNTRREIVQKAAPLFNKKGYEGTSLSELMHATGLQKGGIYRHFASKEKLAAAAFDYSWGRAVEGRLDGLANIPDCVERLAKMIDNFVDLRSGLVPGGCPLMNTAVEADDGNALLRARALKALRGWTERLTNIVVEGIGKKQIQATVDPSKLAQHVIASLEGALLLSRLQSDREALHEMRRHLNDYLQLNVRAKPVRRHPGKR